MATLTIGNKTYEASRVVQIDPTQTPSDATISGDGETDKVVFVDHAGRKFVAYADGIDEVVKGAAVSVAGLSGEYDHTVKKAKPNWWEPVAVTTVLIAGAGGLVGVGYSSAMIIKRNGPGDRVTGGLGFLLAAVELTAVLTVLTTRPPSFAKAVDDATRLSNGLVEETIARNFKAAYQSGDALERAEGLSKMSQVELSSYRTAAMSLGATEKVKQIDLTLSGAPK